MKTMKRLLAAVFAALLGVGSAQALDVKSGDVIAFGGDEIVADATSRETGFAKLVMSGLTANGISATSANHGSDAYSAFEFSYERLDEMLAEKPNVAVVCLGIRDIRDGSKPFSGPTGFGVSISNVIERCQAEGVRPILVTPPVWPEENLSSANNVKLLDYVNLMKAAAAHYGVSCYDFNGDERAYLAAHPASSSNRQLTSDGLKPNARGGQMAARGILRALGATDANVAAAEAAWAEIKSGTTVTLKLSERQFRTIVQAAKNAGQYKETDYLPETKAYVLGLIRQSQSVPKVDPYPMTKVPGCYDAPANKTYSYQSGQKVVLLGDSISAMARDHACGYDKLVKWGLEAAGFSDVTVDNQGRSGDTSSGMLERMNLSGAKYLVLQDGVNDAQDGNPNQYHTIEKFTANMNAIAEKCKAAGVELIMMTPTVNGEASWQLTRHKPSMYIQNDIAPTIRNVAQTRGLPMIELWERWHAFRKYGEQNGFVHVPESLVRYGRLNQHEFFVYDGTHVYWEGYRDMARRILRALGVPESKMSDVEEAWLDKPNLFDMSIGLSVDADEMVSAGAAAMNMTAAEYVRDVILFPVGKANSWTTEPSISKTTWKDNETAGTLSFGAAAHGTVTCNYTQAQLNALGEGVYTVKFSVAADGEYAGLSKSIVVTVTSSAAVNSWTTEPSLSKTSWKEGQAGTISTGKALYGEVTCNYTQQDLNGLPEGSYTVKFTVAGVAKQYTGLEKTISVTVSSSQAANAWKTEPSVTPAKWCEGETAGVLSLGEAEYGTVTCDYTQAQLDGLTKGSYTLTFTVAAKANEYKGLTKTVTVRVMTAGGGETPVLDESSNLIYKDTAALADAGNETVGSQVTPTDCKVGYADTQAKGLATGGHCLWVENSDVTLLNGTYLFNEFELVKGAGTSIPTLTVGEGATLNVKGKNGDLEHASQGTTAATLLRAEAGGAINLAAASVIVDQGRAAAMRVELDGGSLTLANQVANSGAAFGSLTVKNGGAFTQNGNSQGYLIRSGAGSVTVDNGTMKIAQQFGIWTDSSALTVKGANAKITCGSFDHDGANTLTFVIPSAGWAAAPFEAKGSGGGYQTGRIAFKSADKAKFEVDATGYAVAANATVKVPLMTAQSGLTLDLANLVTKPVVTCASGVTGELVVEGNTLYVKLTAGGSPEPPVTPAENAWTVEPSVSKTGWTEGEAAGTLVPGAAKSGGSVTCNYTQAQLNALAKGTYTVSFAVAATDAWTGLSKSITVTVLERKADPEPPAYDFVTTETDLRVKDGAKCLLVGDSIMAYGGSYGYAPLTRKFLEKIGVSLAKWDCNGAGGRSTDHLVDESSNCYLPHLVNGKGYDFVFIQIGVNDQNAGRPWELYTERLNWIFQTIVDAGATPVLIGICSNNTGSPGAWPNLQKDFCAKHEPPVLYCDCSKYETEAYKADGIRNSGDGIHPNYYGYRWMAWAMCKALGAKDADKETAIAFFDDYYRSIMYFSVDFLDADAYGRTPLGPSQSVFKDDCATAPDEPSHDDVTFVGWSPDGGVSVYSSAEVNRRKVTGPVAYTAVYKTGKEERDTSGTTYTWKGGASGDWRTKSNWDMTAAGVLGYPDHETYATAVFTSGASVDLGDTTNALAKLTLPDSGTVTLKNGGVRVASPANMLDTAKHLALDNCTLYCIDQNVDVFGSTTAHMTLDLSNGAYFNGKGYMWNYSSGNDVNAFNSLGGDNRVRDIWLRSGKCGVTVKSGSLATTGGYGFYVESGTMTVGTDSGTFKPHKVDIKGGTIVFNAKLGASPKPVLDATGKTANFSNAKVTFNVDASAVTANGTYPIAVAQTLTFGSGKLTLSVTDKASGCTATLRENGNQIELVVTGGGEPVTPAENAWTTEPSVSKTGWTEGEAAGTLDLGAAKSGGTVACNYTQAQLNALAKGTYTVTFTVAATEAWTGLSKSVTVTVAAKKPSLGAAEWTAYMQGVDTTEELAAVKAAVAGKPTVKIAFANSSTDRSHGTPHDDFEQNEMYNQAKYFGLALEIVRIQPADPASGRTMDVVYREAVDSADIVCDFSSYWDDEEGTVHDGNARELAAQVIAANPDKLFILPYGEISPCPPTGTSLQSMALKRDGTGFRNLITTSPIGPTTGGKLTYVARRTAGDTETITFAIPSGWAGGTGDTCRSASMAGVLAAWIWAARGDSPTAAAIVKMLADASALPEVSDVAGFTSEHRTALAKNLADYAATDALGRSKLIYENPVNMANLLPLIPEPVEPAENAWTTEPSVSKTSWTEGEAAGTLDLGAAKFGTVTCNYTQDALNALAKGTYTVTFTVAEKAGEYTGLEKSVKIVVVPQGTSCGSVTLTCSNYKGAQPLADFPMLVRLSEASIPGFAYDGIGPDLISFRDAEGNGLPCEVDTWDPEGESLVWVKVPSLTSSAQVVLVWGKASGEKPSDTWTAYDGVWHFNETSGTAFADSKGTYGAASVAAPGSETHVSCTIGAQKLGNGVALANDGVKREGNMLTVESRTLSGAITVSGWYQVTKLRDSTSDTYPNLIRGGAWQGGGFYLQCGTTGDNKSFTLVAHSNQLNYNQNPETVLGGGLHHVAVTVGSNGSKLYIDGTERGAKSDARLSSWTGNFCLLASVRSASADEVRVQPTVASPDWITTDYRQQASEDGKLYVIGDTPVEPEENAWTTEPSVSKTSWTEGEAAGTLDLGAAKYGTVACNYTQAQLNALAKGTYTVTFTVPAKAGEYTGLSKSVAVTVRAQSGGGETPELDGNANLVYRDATVTADAGEATVGSQVAATDCKAGWSASQAEGMAAGGHCLWVENADVTLQGGTYLFNEFELVKGAGTCVPTLTVGAGATLNVCGKNGDLEHASQGTTSPTLLRAAAGGTINLTAGSVIVDQGRAAAMAVELDGGSLTLANQAANQGAAFGSLTVKNGGSLTQGGTSQGYLLRSGAGTVTVDDGTVTIGRQFGIWTAGSELTVKGENAKIACGSFDHDNANTLTFVIPSAGWTEAPFQAIGAGSGYQSGKIVFKAADKAMFVVDATARAVAANATVKVPLMTARGGLTLDLATLVTKPVVTCATGVTGELVVEGNTLYAQLTAGASRDAWTEPAEDTPAAIQAALAADGFGAAVQTAFADKAGYSAFKAYCENTLDLVDPKDPAKAGVKANALLGYALGAESVPTEEIASGDVAITWVERPTSGNGVVVGVAIDGFAPTDAKAVPELLAKVVDAQGGTDLNAMASENVAVAGEVSGGMLKVTVSPKGAALADSFFVRVVILK